MMEGGKVDRKGIEDGIRKLSAAHKVTFLCSLAHELTVTARDTDLWDLPPHPDRRGEVLSAILEIEHVVTGQIRRLLLQDEARYPDEVLINIIFDHAERVGIAEPVVRAFRRAQAKV